MKRIGQWLLICVSILMLAGCGKDDADVSIFMTDISQNVSDIREPLEQKLQEKLGEDLKVSISAAALYVEQKVLIEYAAGEHEIMIVPEDVMKRYSQQGAHRVLDEEFDAEKYPEGVFEGGVTDETTNEIVTEKHLFAIPLSKMKIFEGMNFKTEGLFATIPFTSNSVENSVKVLKLMIGE
ncbi:hypothetical protein [Paenibacillus macquariensis]|uniref:Lipoprotein n=1 Tax=Paenibacillus macquariensis TaxID=948756 RepID=A0ABY1JSQ4_9BACL|nr:hypothetical protein [Paenibacillus macquariensis]MEC0092942.1 hypothetical protein [Paenibacillus macquariensis]OAB36307.1 hypothetical protein PMSM_07625 [Paenibacillus macquariensis subsp. macquariensis]SIQ69227.1 hypothetical protein SAMN05421578_103399 [Paenibacillus macquariensis]